jgi:hypothetical protein
MAAPIQKPCFTCSLLFSSAHRRQREEEMREIASLRLPKGAGRRIGVTKSVWFQAAGTNCGEAGWNWKSATCRPVVVQMCDGASE